MIRPSRPIHQRGERVVRAAVDYEALFERARLAATPEACETCLVEIARALESATLLPTRPSCSCAERGKIEPVADPRGL